MENESLEQRETAPDYGQQPGVVLPQGPRVMVVLLVLLGLAILFSMAGALLFQLIVFWTGWDQAVMSGILAPDAAPAERWQMRLLLAISHLGTFILAGWVTARQFYPPARNALAYLRANVWPDIRIVLAGVLLMVVSLPLVLFLYQVNKALPLPESFHLLEKQTNDAIKGLLQMDSSLEFLANLSLIALLPAIGEELVFRGIVQQQLMRRIREPWVALLLTAAVFSFIHFQFEGFLPRLLLGVLLGWLFWRSGNFWVPVAAHFANNGAQVFGQFLYNRQLSAIDLEQDVEVPWFAALISLTLIWLIMRWIEQKVIRRH